jgi:hypothetical protein
MSTKTLTPEQHDLMLSEEAIGIERSRESFGNHPNDFEHTCCFRHQIENIGDGIRNGSGEIITVDMQSGKRAYFKLFSKDYNPFARTGQKNWRFIFCGYL